MTLSPTSARYKPALDEESFQELLAAAYVVQQHKGALRVPDSGSSPSAAQILSIIAEIQSRIRTRGLDLPASGALIAERALELTGATGVSISVVTEGYLQCVGEAGAAANIPGRCISSHSLIATERLKSGGIFESDNSRSDMRLDMDLCRSLGVGSLVAAAILRFDEIAGVIEVRWQREKGFSESEVRACRLFAGLMTGTLERSVRIGHARAAVVEEPPAKAEAPPEAAEAAIPPSSEIFAAPPMVIEPQPEVAAPVEAATQLPGAPSCRMCGRMFAADEAFCGLCSMPRPAEKSSAELQSKWASMWFMQRAQGALEEANAPPGDTPKSAFPAQQELAPQPAPVPEPERRVSPLEPSPLARVLQTTSATNDSYSSLRTRPEFESAPYQAPTLETNFPLPDRSPIAERTTQAARNHWRDAILASVALALAFGLVTAWPKSHSQPTWFQVLMSRVGIMHAGVPSPSFSGSADARVWLDVHTQLYYCQGQDLYGKTPDGEFTTQHNAQADGFQSASNVACP